MSVLRAALFVSVISGCTAVVRGGPLDGKPAAASGHRVFLSTGTPARPYRTVGFVQATGFGNQVAGVLDIGDAGLDNTIQGALADACVNMGGHGVINIEFLDQNPQTPAERARDLVESMQNVGQGKREIKTRWRAVVATGEVVQFTN